MSNYYNKYYSRPHRQYNNYRNQHRNRYDEHYNDYEYYDNRQRFEEQQRQNQYNYHSNVDRQNQYYNNNNHKKIQWKPYDNKKYNNNNNNKHQNYDYNGYYYDDDNDKYYENNTRHNEYDEYQHAIHQGNKPLSYGQNMDYKSRDKTTNIRDMNNWCKYVNITHSIREAYKVNNNNKINILDLGCGKGCDLYKCRGNKKYIVKYLGIDISSECIISARQKYSKILETNIIHKNATYEERKRFGVDNAYGQTAKEFFDEPIFNAQFICDDMNSPSSLTQKLLDSSKPFNLINIQFALHYSFQSKISLLSLFNICNKYMKYGSYFICSFVRDDIIINRLNKESNSGNNSDNICYKNKYQSIRMKKSDFKYIESIYNKYNLLKMDINEIYNNEKDNINNDICDKLIGIPYVYYQMDSVEGNNSNGVEEYLISFPILCKLLWKHCKMKLVYKKTCCDIYIESSRMFPYKYGYSKGRELDNVKWTNDEQSVIDTYCYALFQRM